MKNTDRFAPPKSREEMRIRTPDLGYYIIVTDAKKTEKNYLSGIKESIPVDMQDRLVIKVYHAATEDLVEKCKELASSDSQYRLRWIVFDRDQVANIDDIIYRAEAADIEVGWSNQFHAAHCNVCDANVTFSLCFLLPPW